MSTAFSRCFRISMLTILLFGITASSATDQKEVEQKTVIYQVMTRLFGNTKKVNQPWGSLAENGVGKFSDFNEAALKSIRKLGVTHIWYTGVLHHATVSDFSDYGIPADDPDVVKGRAGSPYAIKDYYSVAPALADDPENRMEEFRSLVRRTHAYGMKVIIDIIPNHVARNYHSTGKPHGVQDFGLTDDTSVAYARDNNFYYVPGIPFEVPDIPQAYTPLGGDKHPLADGHFKEFPAKWTGNGARTAKPKFDDWYETVKLNYGVRPDGTKDYPEFPKGFEHANIQDHAAFWAGKDVPDTWHKMRDIVFFWLDQGVDGFRFDIAELVPVEFWSYLNSAIKTRSPDALLLAEVYNPALFRDYIHLGKMDYLYDKVGLYDTLKAVIQGRASTDALVSHQDSVLDIEHHMLHFLENHDEQRIASPEFAGTPEAALPAMVISATLGTSPTMLYFGQDVGEDGSDDAGFGDPSRTSIFDYVGVPAHQRWMNNGKFDGGALTDTEKGLQDYYRKLMTFTANSKALMGRYQELHTHNRNTEGYDDKVFAFARWKGKDRLVVVSNFDASNNRTFTLKLPASLRQAWSLETGNCTVVDALSGTTLKLAPDYGIALKLAPLQSVILQID
ncbi:MAG: alpha-amylase [Alphaproteobacteria bacterium]|nr:alpha-amylase [Alphaproteobacteria bacterium]